jgi:hypothetical protein
MTYLGDKLDLVLEEDPGLSGDLVLAVLKIICSQLTTSEETTKSLQDTTTKRLRSLVWQSLLRECLTRLRRAIGDVDD